MFDVQTSTLQNGIACARRSAQYRGAVNHDLATVFYRAATLCSLLRRGEQLIFDVQTSTLQDGIVCARRSAPYRVAVNDDLATVIYRAATLCSLLRRGEQLMFDVQTSTLQSGIVLRAALSAIPRCRNAAASARKVTIRLAADSMPNNYSARAAYGHPKPSSANTALLNGAALLGGNCDCGTRMDH